MAHGGGDTEDGEAGAALARMILERVDLRPALDSRGSGGSRNR